LIEMDIFASQIEPHSAETQIAVIRVVRKTGF